VSLPWEVPFVVEVADVPVERHGVWDLYDPGSDGPAPAVVFVPGGPLPPIPVPPLDWPVYRGYGALAAAAGLVGVTVDHPLHGFDAYGAAHEVVARAVDEVRADARVDADRIAVWAFSGGSPLLTPWLARPPEWLRCLAATYPYLDPIPDFPLPEGFRPVQALGAGPSLPFVLTRVGLEQPPVADGVARFLTAAGSSRLDVTIVDVPHGHHGFDTIDPGPESAAAVRAAVDHVATALRG
jgi:acetyl esterase/lipase